MFAAIVEVARAHAAEVEVIAATLSVVALILSEELWKGPVLFNNLLLLSEHNADCGRMSASCVGCADGETGLSLLIFFSVFRLFLLEGLEELLSSNLLVIGRPGTILQGRSVSHGLQ